VLVRDSEDKVVRRVLYLVDSAAVLVLNRVQQRDQDNVAVGKVLVVAEVLCQVATPTIGNQVREPDADRVQAQVPVDGKAVLAVLVAAAETN
jgi:hypothetical protein